MSTDLQRRYCEFRYEGGRRLSGTLMVYGDTADLPWGKERFEPGAFGNVGALDVVMNVQHDRGRPLARTGGGGLELTDGPDALRFAATLPQTREADDALELVRAKVLRGVSVEFMPPSDERREDDVLVIERAELRGMGLVDRPAYPKSQVQPRRKADMDESQVRSLVEKIVGEARDRKKAVDTDAIVEAVRSQVDEALEKRDAAESKRAEAEKDAAKARREIEERSEERANLILMVRELLPEQYNTAGMSNHEIMITACGDEVPGAEDRSEDYLLAKLENIIERRQSAHGSQDRNSPAGAPNGPNPLVNPLSVLQFPRGG